MPIRSILFLTYHFPPEIGGIQTRVAHYMETLSNEGIRVNVFYFSLNQKKAVATNEYGCRVIASPGTIRHFPRNFFAITRAVITEKVNVIHVFSGAATLLSIAALALGRTLGIPSVASFFGREEFDLKTPSQRIGFPIALSLCTSILVNTSYTSTLLPHRHREKTRVILGGAEQSSRVQSAIAKGPVLFVGRLVKSKGIDDLLSAFKFVLLEAPNAKLVIVGDGPESGALKEMAAFQGIMESVRFTGTLRGEPLQDEYMRSAMVVLPSRSVPGEVVTETFGFSLVEGMMHGKPLIGTRHGGIPEVIRDGVNGLLVPEHSPEELARAIVRVLRDKELATVMGDNATRIARSEFTWKAATDRLLESYNPSPPKVEPRQV